MYSIEAIENNFPMTQVNAIREEEEKHEAAGV